MILEQLSIACSNQPLRGRSGNITRAPKRGETRAGLDIRPRRFSSPEHQIVGPVAGLFTGQALGSA